MNNRQQENFKCRKMYIRRRKAMYKGTFLGVILFFCGLLFLFSEPENNGEIIRKALTWKKTGEIPHLGIVFLSTAGGDPYTGDTSVEESLPVLAIRKSGLPRPPYPMKKHGGKMEAAYYQGWSGGTVQLTPPICGYQLKSLEDANEFIQEHLGPDYVMADFHDGKYLSGMDEKKFHGDTWISNSKAARQGGWGFWAFGSIPEGRRFWVHINDQPSNPWDRVPGTHKKPTKVYPFLSPGGK